MFLLLGVELLVLGVEPRALCMLDKFGTSDLNPQFPNTLKPLYPVTLVLWARLGTRVKIIAQQNPGGGGEPSVIKVANLRTSVFLRPVFCPRMLTKPQMPEKLTAFELFAVKVCGCP